MSGHLSNNEVMETDGGVSKLAGSLCSVHFVEKEKKKESQKGGLTRPRLYHENLPEMNQVSQLPMLSERQSVPQLTREQRDTHRPPSLRTPSAPGQDYQARL